MIIALSQSRTPLELCGELKHVETPLIWAGTLRDESETSLRRAPRSCIDARATRVRANVTGSRNQRALGELAATYVSPPFCDFLRISRRLPQTTSMDASTINELIAGSVGGAAQVIVGQPLDTIKTRAQTAPSEQSPLYFIRDNR